MDHGPEHQEDLRIFHQEELDKMLAGVKDYLRQATRANSGLQDQDHSVEDGTYTLYEKDVHGLLDYILDANHQLCKRKEPLSSAPTVLEAKSSSPLAPRSMRPVALTTVDPATTITISEASFTPAVDADNRVRRKSHAATTATVISRDSVIEITWRQPVDSTPALDLSIETASDYPTLLPGMPSSTDQPQEVVAEPYSMGHSEIFCPNKRTSTDSHHSATVGYRAGFSIGDNTPKRRQSSMIIPEGRGEPGPEGVLQSEGSDQPITNVLGRIRKKSVHFGQAMGSFVNGAYRNADYKPRRESSRWCFGIPKVDFGANNIYTIQGVVRMRDILDRLQPARPRPKEDIGIYSAFTGAQPTTPVDQYSARTRILRPSSHTCSEDGRRHRCVQHETDTPPG